MIKTDLIIDTLKILRQETNTHTCSSCKYSNESSYGEHCNICINRYDYKDNWIPKEEC